MNVMENRNYDMSPSGRKEKGTKRFRKSGWGTGTNHNVTGEQWMKFAEMSKDLQERYNLKKRVESVQKLPCTDEIIKIYRTGARERKRSMV